MKREIVAFILLLSFSTVLLSCQQKNKSKISYLPQFHFTEKSNWTGEPTGLIYDEGTYHLFYQYNPSDNVYGNIHWGHAISRDLFQWQIEPIALYPDSMGYLKSGSVIIDKENTSGLGHNSFIAFYMYENKDLEQVLFLAYSSDKGQTWEKCGKIILPNPDGYHFQNPHVSWNPLLKEWLMTISSGSSVLFYKSPDCMEWSFLSQFEDPSDNIGAIWEGTDFFPLKVQGKENITKWVLIVNMENTSMMDLPATRYYVGDFDGTLFRITQTKELWVDYGKDNFAGYTFNGMPDDNRIYLSWMNCWEYANLLPTSSWRGNMTIPRLLSLVWEGKHFLLASTIPTNIHAYYGDSLRLDPITLSQDTYIEKDFPYPEESFIMRLKFDNKDNRAIWKARDYGIRLKTQSGKVLSIGYQNELSYYYIDRGKLGNDSVTEKFGCTMGASYRTDAPEVEWNILFDKNSIELFAADGCSVISSLCYPEEAFSSFEIFAQSGSVSLSEGSIIQLKR